MTFNYGNYVNANANIVNGFVTGNPFAIVKGFGGYMGLLSSLFGDDNANSARMSYEYSRALQEHQYELNRKTRQTAFQDTRHSLVEAGYNPLLAVGQQAQGGTFGATMNVQDPKSENLANALNTANAVSQLKLNSASAFNQFMQGRLTTAQANNLLSQSQLNSAQKALTNLQSNAQAINNLHLPQVLKSQIRLNNNQAQASLINAQANNVSAQANMMNAGSNRMNAQTNSAVGASQQWRNYNQSLGYNTTVHAGPVTFSHTGNPNLYTQSVNGGKPKYQTEYINGKPVQVRVLR